MMRDSYGREIDYARISITDRCNLRCIYCMPDPGQDAPGEDLSGETSLSAGEILRICAAFASLGIRRLKVTGGEPLIRPDAEELIGALKKIPGIERVSLTTNGQLLSGMAEKLRKAGLDEITLSLNTLDGDKYRRLTLGELHKPLEGIDAVFRAGFPRLKINCVPLDAESREDAVSIAALARDRNILTRFIEMMPIGAGNSFPGVSGALVLQWLEAEYGPWELRGDVFGPGPARYGSFRGFTGMAGFINPLSAPFCGSCNRLRLSSGGFIRSCLHREEGIDLRPALEKKDNRKLEEDIRFAILHKPQGHRFGLLPAEGPGMFQIGG